MVIGTLFVYSATMANPTLASAPWYDQSWFRQLVWYALGIGAAAAFCAWWIITRWRAGRLWPTGRRFSSWSSC